MQFTLQARDAAEAMRATLSHVEAALESRESELHESWHALRLQAADLQSDAELTPELLQPDASARVCCCCVSQLAAMTTAHCQLD